MKSGDPCQDSSACEVIEPPGGGQVLICAVSDGAGSAHLSQIGSAEACSFIVACIRERILAGMPVTDFDRKLATDLVMACRNHLRIQADFEGVPVRELACTLVAGVVSNDRAAFFQVGDGVAVVRDAADPPDQFYLVSWPERGEYANTTTFVTEEHAAEHLQHALLREPLAEVALLTDGIQNLVLDYRARAAHSPFFSRMMAPLRSSRENGHDPALSAALAGYLDSKPINNRTDDDKTLVIASRAGVPE